MPRLSGPMDEWWKLMEQTPKPKREWTMPVLRINWPIMALAFFWCLEETKYFGWNGTPHSLAELFADGLGVLIAAIGFLG